MINQLILKSKFDKIILDAIYKIDFLRTGFLYKKYVRESTPEGNKILGS